MSETIRSARDFKRRYFPRAYAEEIGHPPSRCVRCFNLHNWHRVGWPARWRCSNCGADDPEEDAVTSMTHNAYRSRHPKETP